MYPIGQNENSGTTAKGNGCMLRRCIFVIVLIIACLAAGGQEKPGKPGGTAGRTKEGQVTGTVRMLNKDKSTVVIAKGNTERQIIYSADTKWMYGTQSSNRPSSLDDLKEGWYINCKGTFDGVKLNASACRFRETK